MNRTGAMYRRGVRQFGFERGHVDLLEPMHRRGGGYVYRKGLRAGGFKARVLWAFGCRQRGGMGLGLEGARTNVSRPRAAAASPLLRQPKRACR
eukprot:scaffold51213_cov315-Isochrysis_galbana.AAC.1